MSEKKRILFIASEISPFLELTEFADSIRILATNSQTAGWEVRCIMPKFGTINERRNKLHEVVRLSGINIQLHDEDYSLQIKVASIPNARLQVYFLENEEFFKRKNLYYDDDNKWFDDNDLRTIFFCKGALETTRKFGWPPHIIHCSGWLTSLIPMYIKTVYKFDPIFSFSKTVYSIGAYSFKEKFSKNFLKLVAIHQNIKPKHVDTLSEQNNYALLRTGATFADAVTIAEANVDKKLIAEFSNVKGKSKKFLDYVPNNDNMNNYIELFENLTN